MIKRNAFLLLTAIIIIISGVLIPGCEKSDNPGSNNGELVFSINQIKTLQGEPVLKSTVAKEKAVAIIVTIVNSTGKTVIDHEEINLYNMNGSFITNSILLPIGSYQLTEFLVTDKNNRIIYITPMAGSTYAYLLSSPLPLDFDVMKDQVTKLVPEVLTTEGLVSVANFGYMTFDFNIIEIFGFLINVQAFNDSTQKFEFISVDITVRGDGELIYTGTLPAGTDSIKIKDGYANYQITVKEIGGSSVYTILTNCQLKEYNKDPLSILFECTELTDIDGNVYKTAEIGEQIWMAENLKTTKFNDGEDIPLIEDFKEWEYEMSPGYCWYNNDEITYNNPYGALYNWHTVKSGNLCPTGWHEPKLDEWYQLVVYLGGPAGTIVGEKLMESGSDHWGPNDNATNESGFTALPGGYRMSVFSNIGSCGFWWTSTPYSAGAYYISIARLGNMTLIDHNKNNGFSVRCIKD